LYTFATCPVATKFTECLDDCDPRLFKRLLVNTVHGAVPDRIEKTAVGDGSCGVGFLFLNFVYAPCLAQGVVSAASAAAAAKKIVAKDFAAKLRVCVAIDAHLLQHGRKVHKFAEGNLLDNAKGKWKGVSQRFLGLGGAIF
jgi:hypothetical protein